MAVPPPPPPLSARLRQLCDDLIDHLVPGPAMTMAEQIRAKLAAPLTITVAGGVSSGKSTLVNALLGQRIAAVDAGECTRVVSEFRYGTHERVEVVAVDGAVTTLPLNRGRMPDHLGMPVERVRHVVVHLSNALLNHISVVDTPGLNTVTEVNEEATANFLGVSGREGVQTADAVSKADALVFLLPLLRQADAQVLRGFSKLFGDSSLSAANAIAVLSKVDRLAKGDDPLAAAAPIADRIATELRGVVSAVLPVVGLLAESAEAAVFTEADARALAAVAAVDDPLDREDMLLTADDFLSFDLLELDEPARRRLLSLLDLYGLRVAVAAADQGARTASDFLRVFGEASGFRALRDVIVRRFAGQSEAFKAHAALNDLRRASYLRSDPDNVRALRALRSPLEKLEFDPAFVQLRLLEVAQAVSRGDLRLPDELMGDVLALADAGDPRSVVGASAFSGRDAAAAGAARWSAWGNDSRRSPNESRMARMVKEAFEAMWLEFEKGGTVSEDANDEAIADTGDEGTDTGADDGAKRNSRDPLATQVSRLANKVHAAVRDWDRPDLAERVTAEAEQWTRQQLVVVACGDIKRGKSSLLNAVLDQPGLLPVDADVATSVHLVVRHADEFDIVVTRLDDNGEPRQEHVTRDDLVDVASMRGDASRREGVMSVEIGVDNPLLARGIVLIDTPGVGGMSRGHRDLALAALGQADALLFTVSAEEPVARSELEFLVEASERTEHIVMVVTKADTNSEAANGEMIAEHRAKIRTFAETQQRRADEGETDADVSVRLRRVLDAPFVLTSSFLAEQARVRAEAGRAEQAERLLARSGIGDLRTLLDRSADNREIIRVANLIALLRVLLGDVERETQARQRAASGDNQVAEDLAARQRMLEEFGSKQARWRGTLGNSIVRLQTGASRLVTKELNRVRESYREIIDATEDSEVLMAALPSELERSLHGAWNEMVKAINDDFQSTLGTLLADLGAEGMDIVLGEMEMPEELRQLSGARSNARPDSFLDDGLPTAMQTYTFANIANSAAGALGLATGGLGLVAYGIGAAVAIPIGKMRKKSREKQRLKMELHRYVGDLLFGQEGVSREFSTELSLRILDLREQVELFVEQRLAERRKQLEREHREAQALLRSEMGKRQEVQRNCAARLKDIERLRGDIEPLQQAVDQRLSGRAAGGAT